ncbi:MAG: hypothetical protein HQL91_03700 [Magnetococcales bacterium]|nr:hypothetical protein [Magnetococcales bacterium]
MTFDSMRMRVGGATGVAPLADHPAVRAAVTGKSRVTERSAFCWDTPDLKLARGGMILTACRPGSRWQAGLSGVQAGGEGREWECGNGERPDWGDLKRQLPEFLSEGIKIKSLEPLLTIEQREERWRLEYPDGARIVLRELRGRVTRPEGGEEQPFHDVVLEGSGGAPVRFLQTALAVGRHFSALLEPLGPVARALVRRDSTLLVPVAWHEGGGVTGERVIGALARAGAARVGWIRDQLAPLVHGVGAIRIQAAGNLIQAVAGLHRLIQSFGELLPEPLRRDMESELHWLSGELAEVAFGAGLVQATVPWMCDCFPEDAKPLEARRVRAQQAWDLALERAVRAVDSFRFTRLFMGFAIWLGSEEGLKAATMESDAGVRERLHGSVEGMARELIRRGSRVLVEGDCAAPLEVLARAEALDEILALFAGAIPERKSGVQRSAVTDLVRSARRVVELEAEQRLWQRAGSGDGPTAVDHLFRGWQGARLEAARSDFRLTWEPFSGASSLSWLRD